VGHSYREIEANPNAIAIRTSVINLAEQNFAEIRIADNGPGITPEVQQHLFDAFFTTKPEGKGTGLGLSISYQIITEKHGGQMQCVSTPGKGAEFIIQIPI
jgi:signal transduction histidine kinase